MSEITNLIGQTQPEKGEGTSREEFDAGALNRSRLGSLDVHGDEMRGLVRECFAAGVQAWGKQGAYATRIQINEPHLSDMLAGKRPIHLKQALPLLATIASAKAFTGWQCRMSGLLQPELADVVQLSKQEARLLSWLMSTPAWGLFLGPLVARQFYRVELDLLEVGIHATLRLGQ